MSMYSSEIGKTDNLMPYVSDVSRVFVKVILQNNTKPKSRGLILEYSRRRKEYDDRAL